MKSRRKHRSRNRSRRGAIAVLAALLLVVVFAMLAFAVDLGYITHVDTELQRTADAAALAAVMRLPDKTAALSAAQLAAVQNKGYEGPTLGAKDVVFGRWNRDTATFSASSSNPNAVKVICERTASDGNPLRLFFASVIGNPETDISTSAVAMYEKGFCGPLVGIEWVSVPGDSTTDSFRSSSGSYDSQTPRNRGSICSDGPIGLEGNPVVNGDANPGRGCVTTLEGGSIVTGNMTPRLRPLNLSPVDASPYEFSNDNGSLPLIPKGKNYVSPVDGAGNFLLDGGKTYTMPTGVYYFNNMTLTGQSTLDIVGHVVIYLTGNLDTSGGYLINTTNVADNLQILMQGGAGTTANVTAGADLYAVIYAPDTAVTTQGNAGFFGAVVGRTLEVTGTGDIHYDEDLDLSRMDVPKRIALVQ